MSIKSLMGDLLEAFKNKHGVLVKSWKAADGSSWYRKYSDGWIEQGGFIGTKSAGEIPVTFPLAFSNTYYTMYGQRATHDSSNQPTVRQLAAARTRSTTGFTYIIGSNESKTNCNWGASGF